MMPDEAGEGLLDFLPEPSFILTRAGDVVQANRAARRLLGGDRPSGHLSDHLLTPRGEVDDYLRRSSTTTSPVLGSLEFRTPDGGVGLRTQCARLAGGQGEVRLALRCWSPQGDEFSILAQKVRELNAEIGARRREKTVLKEALRRNENLARELQHRVKNNIQMMISLLTMSAATTGSDEVRQLLDTAGMRLQAMATAQELIYQSGDSTELPARPFFENLTAAISDSVYGSSELQLAIANVSLRHETAHCLALVVNELVSNSVQHGLRGGPGAIRISLDRSGPDFSLVVQDTGGGFPEATAPARSSGLGLVRGLCRQMGGTLELVNDGGGAKSIVRFPAAK